MIDFFDRTKKNRLLCNILVEPMKFDLSFIDK